MSDNAIIDKLNNELQLQKLGIWLDGLAGGAGDAEAGNDSPGSRSCAAFSPDNSKGVIGRRVRQRRGSYRKSIRQGPMSRLTAHRVNFVERPRQIAALFCAMTFWLVSPARSLDLSIDGVLDLVFKNPGDPDERIVATGKLVAFLEKPKVNLNVLTMTLVERNERGFLFDDTYFSAFAAAYLVKQDWLMVRVKAMDENFDRLGDWTKAADINVYTGYEKVPTVPRADQAVDIKGSCALVVTLTENYSVTKVDSYVLGGDADPLKMERRVMACFAASFLRFSGVQSVDPERAIERYRSKLHPSRENYGLTHEYDAVLRLSMQAILKPGMTRREAAAALWKNPEVPLSK